VSNRLDIARFDYVCKTFFLCCGREKRRREKYAHFSGQGIILPLGLALLFALVNPFQSLFAQQIDSTAATDSSSLISPERSVYEIDRFRLLRWVRAHQDTSARDFLLQTLNLITEADGFARQRDYITARLILDTAMELTHLRSNASTLSEPGPNLVEPAQRSTLAWRREALFGVDLWRQEFELGFADAESLYVDRDGNPFVGLRISLNHDPTPKLNSRPPKLSHFASTPETGGLSFDAFVLLKSSRDYYSGELEFNGGQSFGNNAFWRFQNRSEGTSYRRDFDLQYWQNTTSALAATDLHKNWRLEVSDEFRVRRYRNATEIYPNYIQNQASLGAVFSSGYTTRLDSRYSYIVRVHDACPADDYVEHRVDAAVFQGTASNSSVLLENIWRHRIYPGNVPGNACRKTYQNTYQEEYARADLRLGFNELAALRIEGDFTLRQYEAPSDTTPDFLGTTVNPQLQLRLFADLQMSVGYLYLLRVYDKNIIQVNRPTTVDEPAYLFYEDYYSHGFTLGLDLIRAGGLLFSVNENFEMRTYPNSTAQTLPGFGLYSDRNINSLLLFFSWNFHPSWQAGVLANFDNDRSRVDNQSDSRNTLFSIDLSYSF
jgi:hypothetical protein